MLKRLGLLVGLLALLLTVTAGYWWVINTPEYALINTAEALEAQNFDRLDQRVNFDGVAGQLAEQVVQQQVKDIQASGSNGGLLGAFGQGVGIGLVQMMKPAITAQAVAQVKAFCLDKANAPKLKGLENKATMLMLFRQFDTVQLQPTQIKDNTARFVAQVDKVPVTVELKPTGPKGWEITQVIVPPEHLAYLLGQQVK